jgi:hypothetical protein
MGSYSEAIDLLYRTTTFVFNDPQLFRIFPRFVLPKRLQQMTSIEAVWRMPALTQVARPGVFNGSLYYPEQIKYFNELCTVFANMPNLSYLKIVLVDYHCPRLVPQSLQQMWLGPFEKLSGKSMKVFEVWVPESYAAHLIVGKQSPFELKSISDIGAGYLDDFNHRFAQMGGSDGCGPVGYWLCSLPLPFPAS